jgi:hypothetical protein
MVQELASPGSCLGRHADKPKADIILAVFGWNVKRFTSFWIELIGRDTESDRHGY